MRENDSHKNTILILLKFVYKLLLFISFNTTLILRYLLNHIISNLRLFRELLRAISQLTLRLFNKTLRSLNRGQFQTDMSKELAAIVTAGENIWHGIELFLHF